MQYKHAPGGSYEDFASGRVLFNLPGLPNFPARLAQEIFLRCVSYLDVKEGLRVYDPCCGGGCLLTVIGFLNYKKICLLAGSDIDADALRIAKRNLSLLDADGLSARAEQLREMSMLYGKASHAAAADSGAHMQKYLISEREDMTGTLVFEADILNENSLNVLRFKDESHKFDVVAADLPYGSLTAWQGVNTADAVYRMLSNLAKVMKPGSVAALCMDKGQKVGRVPDGFGRMEKQHVGKRRFEIYRFLNHLAPLKK